MIRIERPAIVLPEAAKRACAKPVTLPDADLTSGEVVTKWGADRAALVMCEQRRAAAVAAIEAGSQE